MFETEIISKFLKDINFGKIRIIKGFWRSLEYLYTFCYGLLPLSWMDVCRWSYKESLRIIRKMKNIPFLETHCTGKNLELCFWSSYLSSLPYTLCSNTFFSVCFLSVTHCLVTMGWTSHHWRKKKKKCS